MKLTLPCVAVLFAAPLLATSAAALGLQAQPAEQPATATEAATADDTKPAEAPVQAAPEVRPEEKLICRRVKLTMDSRRATKVCKTSDEWRAFNEER